MKLEIYEQLFRMNQGFEDALDALGKLSKNPVFNRSQMRRFEDLARETQAATNSYLLEAMGTDETQQAGRLERKQRRRTRND